MALNEEVERKRQEELPEVDRDSAVFFDEFLEKNPEKYRKRIEAAKKSRAVKAFNAEGERLFCELCAITVFDALSHGDAPFVGTKVHCSEAVLRANEYLMPVRLGEKELVDDTLELIHLFTEDGCFISDHDEEVFYTLFDGILKKLKLYYDSNPRGYGKLAGMGIIRALEQYEGTEMAAAKVREMIR